MHPLLVRGLGQLMYDPLAVLAEDDIAVAIEAAAIGHAGAQADAFSHVPDERCE